MFLSENYNPFQSVDFYASPELHAFLRQYSSSAGSDGTEEGANANTFTRQIDGWLLAAAFGAGDYDEAFELQENKSVKFISGPVLKGNTSAISYLCNLAVGLTGDVDVIRDPKRVVRIAWNCAEHGYKKLKDAMQVGNLTPPAVSLAGHILDLNDDL